MESPSPRPTDQGKRNEIVGLQYLRGIAAIAVVLDHSAGMASFDKYFGTVVFGNALAYGAHGVDIFFVLSGFIIAYVALRPTTLVPDLSFATFLLKRALRILPLMWLAIGSYALMRTIGGIPNNWLDYVRATFLFPIGPVAPLNIWTLRHEALFYLFFGVTWLAYPRIRYLLFVWFLAPLLIWMLSTNLSASQISSFLLSPLNLEFGAGFCLGLLYLKCDSIQIYVRYQFAVLVAATSVMIGAAFATGQNLGTLESTIFACIWAIPIVAFAAFAQPVKHNFIGLLLGEASYSIYLFHPHIISFAFRCLKSCAPSLNVYIATLVACCAGITGGVLIHIYIEKPLLKMRTGLFRRSRPSKLAPST